MPLEYDTNTRRMKVQISEAAFRVIENKAHANGISVSRCARNILEDALEDSVAALSLEDQLLVAERVRKNIKARMEKRG